MILETDLIFIPDIISATLIVKTIEKGKRNQWKEITKRFQDIYKNSQYKLDEEDFLPLVFNELYNPNCILEKLIELSSNGNISRGVQSPSKEFGLNHKLNVPPNLKLIERINQAYASALLTIDWATQNEQSLIEILTSDYKQVISFIDTIIKGEQELLVIYDTKIQDHLVDKGLINVVKQTGSVDPKINFTKEGQIFSDNYMDGLYKIKNCNIRYMNSLDYYVDISNDTLIQCLTYHADFIRKSKRTTPSNKYASPSYKQPLPKANILTSR